MKLKIKVCVDNENLFMFINHDIFFFFSVYCAIKALENCFKRKAITKNTNIEFNEKLINILNTGITANLLSLWKRAGLCNFIKRDKDFNEVSSPIMETINIIKPINHVFLTGSVTWN
jgi:hypothetical protein